MAILGYSHDRGLFREWRSWEHTTGPAERFAIVEYRLVECDDAGRGFFQLSDGRMGATVAA